MTTVGVEAPIRRLNRPHRAPKHGEQRGHVSRRSAAPRERREQRNQVVPMKTKRAGVARAAWPPRFALYLASLQEPSAFRYHGKVVTLLCRPGVSASKAHV